MNTGIEINFFEPHAPEAIYYGKLYLDAEGKNYLEFQDNIVKHKFDPIKAAFATDVHSNEQYSLINCAFNQTDFKTFRYRIHEIYKGAYLDKVTDNNCISAEARMTHLSSWINYPRLLPKVSSSIHEPSSIVLKEQFIATFNVNENTSLELSEFCAESFNKREVVLKNVGYIRFSSDIPISRLELYHHVSGFLKLLSIFTDTTPKLTQLEFTLNSERVVELLFPEKLKMVQDETDPLLDYKKMEDLWPVIINNFYAERNKFVKVLNLLIESLENKTAEVSFLNSTTAFEIYHKYFFEQEIAIQQQLSLELFNRKIIQHKPNKWIQIVRYYHILDIVKDFDFFKAHFTDIDKVLIMMIDSRNYYTHYSETKNKIWTPNQLLYINLVLRQVLKAAILKKLGLSELLINKLLNNRSAYFYHNYEKNEYSLNYLPPNE